MSDFLGFFNDLLLLGFSNSAIISIWTKNSLIEENIHFFLIQNVRGSIVIIGKKYLIGNSEAYSVPSLTSTIELFAKAFNGKKLFSGIP